MKGATPVPGPTMIMGNAGSEGRRKETFDRRLTKIWEGGEGGEGGGVMKLVNAEQSGWALPMSF